VLKRRNRLVSSEGFAHTVRRGRKAGTATVVLHLVVPPRTTLPRADPPRADFPQADPPQVGFVVSKAVGAAVARNLVKRRLRHVVRKRLASLPDSAVLVVRALPGSAEASYDTLGIDFDAALARLTGRLHAPGASR